MEKVVKQLVVHGSQCIGCLRHNRQVMIAIRDAADMANCKFTDVFLTTKQAESLVREISEVLLRSAEEVE